VRAPRFALNVGVILLAASAGYMLRPHVESGPAAGRNAPTTTGQGPSSNLRHEPDTHARVADKGAPRTLEPDPVAAGESAPDAGRAVAADGSLQQDAGPTVEVRAISHGTTYPGVADDGVVIDPATGRASLPVASNPGAAAQSATDDELVISPDTGEVRLRQASHDLASR
jgi:hypothetical protein